MENYSEDLYVIAGLERFKKDVTQHGVPSNIYEDYIRHIMSNTNILPIHSHPRRIDTDGDGYNDYAETRIYLSSPLKNDVKKAFIDYICIYDEMGNSWFKKNYSNTEPFNTFKTFDDEYHSFGGNQGWFAADTVFKEKLLTGEIVDERERTNYDTIAESGCGLIATVDILLYHNRIHVDKNADGTWNKKSYIEEVFRQYKTNFTVRKGGMMLFEVADWIEIFDMDTYTMKISNAGEDKIKNNIYDNVVNKNPVVLLIDSLNNRNEPICCYLEKDNGNKFYTEIEVGIQETETVMKPLTVDHHFMIITGIVDDRVKEKTYIQISTWGRKYYVDLDDVVKYAKENMETFWAVNGLIFVEESIK